MASDPATRVGRLHADATAVLRGWSAPTPEQEDLRRSYLAHLAAHPDGVVKAGPPAHLTASCLVLSDDGSEVLLTHHRKADAWFQLGGHLEPQDASLHAAATREAREESGLPDLAPSATPLQLDRHVLVGAFGRCHEHLDVRYAALAPRGSRPVVSAESHDVRWWPVEGLEGLVEPSLVHLVSLARTAFALAGAIVPPGSPAPAATTVPGAPPTRVRGAGNAEHGVRGRLG